jgi:hypothetical protein
MEIANNTINLVNRGIIATNRCCNALKRIFIALGSKLLNGKLLNIFYKFTNNFLFILGSLFFIVFTFPTIIANNCFTKLTKDEKCLESLNILPKQSPIFQAI